MGAAFPGRDLGVSVREQGNGRGKCAEKKRNGRHPHREAGSQGGCNRRTRLNLSQAYRGRGGENDPVRDGGVARMGPDEARVAGTSW